MKQTVIAFDPGGTTGWAKAEWDEARTKWSSGQMGPHEHHLELWSMLVELYLAAQVDGIQLHVVTESFEFRQGTVGRTGLDLHSKEYIGVMKLFAELHGRTLWEQTASTGKGFVSDAKLKASGLWIVGQQHARDANRHLLYYMINKLGRRDLVKPWRSLA
jgi:hypothetical protein